MKIVVVGAGGRLGAALVREWRALGNEVVGFDHRSLDLAEPGAAAAPLAELEFEALVNCAALTNVDYCETHVTEAYRINAEAVREIATACREKGAQCVHISTDYVFDGAAREPYREDAATGPLGVYAASKLAGEHALLEISEANWCARVSWVFGPDRPSFVDQILKRALETEQLAAVSDKVAVPTYTLDLARWLHPFLSDVRGGGILHLCNGGSCTWQEYGQFALDRARAAGAPLVGHTVTPQRIADIAAFIAPRPVYTVMNTAKLTALTGLQPRSWQDAVAEYVTEQWLPANVPNRPR